MLNKKTIAVVVPTYNEEKQIGYVIESMPKFVDKIIVVNDCSKDDTERIIREYIENDSKGGKKKSSKIKRKEVRFNRSKYNEADIVLSQIEKKESKKFIPSEIMNKYPEKDRIILINNLKNGGVGAAIARGYKWCLDHKIDCTAVMAGDGQMDPDELESICRPVVDEGIDYAKGNRLIHRSALFVIPKIRFFGNSVLSLLTKVASGYWHVSDSQTGYTAISFKALNSIRIHKIYKGYGMPNDMLVKLNIAFCTIKEVEIKPVYRVGEKSKMKVFKVIPKVSLLLMNSFFNRLWIKYFFRDFHPLFFLYHFAFLLGIINIPVTIEIIKDIIYGHTLTFQMLIAFMFLSISSFQSLLFAMWMDIQDNDRLHK